VFPEGWSLMPLTFGRVRLVHAEPWGLSYSDPFY